MKVLHIVSNIALRNGVMSVIMNYYRNMNLNDFSFEFLYFDDREITYKEEIEKLGGKIYKIERSKNPFKLFLEINKFLKEHIEDYKIIHLHEIFLIGALIGIKRRNKNIKIISHAHATKFSDRKLANIRNHIFAIPNKVIPDKYFACSYDAGNVCFGKKFKQTGNVLNNAINLSKFYPDKNLRNQTRNELGIDDKYVVGHVGNFNAQKNHFFLIDIFYELQKVKDNAVLLLVGDGERRISVLNKCQQLGIMNKVIYLGTRDDINRIMNSLDCFLLPSIYEGLGIVLIEAQATGVPCVFTDVIPKEANILMENNIKLSLNDNPKIWADSILKSKREDREDILEEIQNAGYDIELEAKKLEQYYKSIIN